MRAFADTLVADRPGTRIFKSSIVTKVLSPAGQIGRCVDDLLGPSARPVRALMFDKSPDTNWALSWHQDRTIAVRTRIDVPGYGPWSVKAGVAHVEPPIEITQAMITLRLHLDDVDADNAPLLIAPGSHRLGRVPAAEIDATIARLGSHACLARAGDVWAYATAILHASDAARHLRRRRVLQVDFTKDELPGGLAWLGIGD